MPALAILLVVLIGAGVSVGAEGATPGDALYPIKVSVNENVRSVLAVSLESEAFWEGRQAERRLEEAEELASRGELTATIAADLEARFQAHAERAREHLLEMENRENWDAAVDLSSHFESALAAHDQVLLLVRTQNSDTEAVDAIIRSVRSEHAALAQVRAQAEAKVSIDAEANSDASIRARLGAIENHITELRSKIERLSAEMTAEARAEAEARIDRIISVSADAAASLEAELREESYILLRQAERGVLETRLFLEARKNLDLNLESSQSDSSDTEEQGDMNTEVETEIQTGVDANVGGGGAGASGNAGVNSRVDLDL